MKYKEKLTQKSVNYEIKGTGYTIGKPEDNEIITQIIFDGTTAEKNSVKAYWLPSRGVCIGSEYANFGPGAVGRGSAGTGGTLFGSYGMWNVHEFAVRPVVSLKSEVTVKNIEKCDGEEKEWIGEGPKTLSLESGNIEEGQIG